MFIRNSRIALSSYALVQWSRNEVVGRDMECSHPRLLPYFDQLHRSNAPTGHSHYAPEVLSLKSASSRQIRHSPQRLLYRVEIVEG
jgi:hypothetical protein